MKKGIIALICMILTLVFIIVALIGPWYNRSAEVTDGEAYQNFKLTGVDTKIPDEDVKTKSWDKFVKEDMDNTDKAKSVKSVFDICMFLTLGALITAILALIGVLVMTFGFGNIKPIKMLGGIFGIITVILTIVAVLYFMVALPPAVSNAAKEAGFTEDIGFWDETNISGNKVSYGPGFAWYLMIVAFVLSLIGTIIVFIDKPSTIIAPPR